MTHTTYTPSFAPAYPAPLRGIIRSQATDFRVNEQMAIPLSGSGEHLWLQVRKTGANTDWVAQQLAQAANIPVKNIGYAGLKDRHAVTTQWFSLQLPGRADPDFSSLAAEIEILEQQRHDKKLKRGALTANHFVITLRDIQGDTAQARSLCEQIKQHGIPNYFGRQRFGHDYGNLCKAEAWFSGQFTPKQRHQRSLYLSAARAWLFNHVLSKRIEQNNWHQAIPGDVFMLAGGHSWFVDDGSADLAARVAALELHPTGMLWGKGELPSQQHMQALELEQAALFPLFCQGLEQHGLKQERRALRTIVADLSLTEVAPDVLRLAFSLPAGAYATSLLAQLGQFAEPGRQAPAMSA